MVKLLEQIAHEYAMTKPEKEQATAKFAYLDALKNMPVWKKIDVNISAKSALVKKCGIIEPLLKPTSARSLLENGYTHYLDAYDLYKLPIGNVMEVD
jgi:hypothetical protein